MVRADFNNELNQADKLWSVFAKEAGLGRSGCGCSRFAAGYADYAEDGEFGEGGSGDVDAVGVGVEIGRGQLQAAVLEGEKIVGNDAFEAVAIAEAQAHPQAIEFGAAEEGFALHIDILLEVANEIDGADFDEENFFVLAGGREEVQGFSAGQLRGVKVASQKLLFKKLDDDLFVGRGWSFSLQTDFFRQSS